MFIVTDLVSLNGCFCKQSDQDIASQYTVFRQRLHCLLRFKIYCLRTKIQINLEITTCDPPINTCTMNETVSGLWKSQKFYNLFYNNSNYILSVFDLNIGTDRPRKTIFIFGGGDVILDRPATEQEL